MTPEGQLIESLLQIASKEGEDVEFKLNPAQYRLDMELTGRDLVPKARQEGVSSYVLARFLIACLMYRNTRAVVISHDRESTQRLLTRVQYYIEHIRGPAPVVKNMSKNEITFPKTNSMFYLGTAGARSFGRGDTITHLHCSEYAYWGDAPRLMTGLLQAVPKTGEIIIESTGNGYNDYYHRCMRAEKGQSIWACHFLPWHDFPEYKLDVTEGEARAFLNQLNEDWEEPRLHKEFGLTAAQLLWRRWKLDELDYDLRAFKQEYPTTLDECFQMSSDSIFTKVRYEPTERWEQLGRGFWVLKDHPSPRLHYYLGADPAGGLGQDSSTIEVFCAETNEQVGEYSSERIDPEAFGYKVSEIGHFFNTAYAVVESNNHGVLTLAVLEKIYPHDRIHRERRDGGDTETDHIMRLGWRTTSSNKQLLIGRLRTELARTTTIHSPLLQAELSTFVEDEKGKLGAQEGCHDDLVIAAACAMVGKNWAVNTIDSEKAAKARAWKNPLLLENIIDELHTRGSTGRFPVKPQTGSVH